MVGRQPTDHVLHTGSDVLVYLIHGVTGAPIEMHYVAKGLARHSWDVYATTLPGHCTRIKHLVRTSEQDWREHVQRQLAFARERYASVFVAGLSAGALLALEAATVVAVDGVGVLSPTFVYDGWNTPWSNAILPYAMKLVPLPLQHLLFHIDGPPMALKRPSCKRDCVRPTVPWLFYGNGFKRPCASVAGQMDTARRFRRRLQKATRSFP